MPQALKYAIAVIIALWVGNQIFLMYSYKTYGKEEIESAFEPITAKYGVQIKYEIGNDFFSPIENLPISAGPPKNSITKPIRHRVLLRYPALLRQAFEKYPVDVVKKHLKIIQFVGEIDADGRKAAGTYDPFRSIIYLVNNGTQNNDQAMSTIHHELSSLFLKHNSFFINPWIDNHPKGFKYFNDIYDDWRTIKEVRNALSDNDCYEKGFVSDYGLTNFENDFNEYAEMIFTYPQKFKKIMDRYPRVRAKFLVWLDFYHKIDPVFTEEYLFGIDGHLVAQPDQ